MKLYKFEYLVDQLEALSFTLQVIVAFEASSSTNLQFRKNDFILNHFKHNVRRYIFRKYVLDYIFYYWMIICTSVVIVGSLKIL